MIGSARAYENAKSVLLTPGTAYARLPERHGCGMFDVKVFAVQGKQVFHIFFLFLFLAVFLKGVSDRS